MGDMDSQQLKIITICTIMARTELVDVCKHAFSSQAVWSIEVLWKEGNRNPTQITANNCSQVLRCLEGRRGGDKLVVYCYDDDESTPGLVRQPQGTGSKRGS